jgi:DNA-directed RNA polymerase subunit M/transcription elongation factor TFIIS
MDNKAYDQLALVVAARDPAVFQSVRYALQGENGQRLRQQHAPSQLARLSYAELMPDWSPPQTEPQFPQFAALLQEGEFIRNLTDERLLTCPGCSGHDIDWYTRQNRGTDEPATAFMTCRACGTRWNDQ